MCIHGDFLHILKGHCHQKCSKSNPKGCGLHIIVDLLRFRLRQGQSAVLFVPLQTAVNFNV